MAIYFLFLISWHSQCLSGPSHSAVNTTWSPVTSGVHSPGSPEITIWGLFPTIRKETTIKWKFILFFREVRRSLKINWFSNRGVDIMRRTHKSAQNESNLMIRVVSFAILTPSEPLKASYSSPGMCLSVYKKIRWFWALWCLWQCQKDDWGL